MASIHITGSGETIEASSAVSILNNLLQKGIKISHVCGGKAICGTCRIRIVKQSSPLSKITAIEKGRLAAVGNPPGKRLACQTYPVGEVWISIDFEKPPGSGAAP